MGAEVDTEEIWNSLYTEGERDLFYGCGHSHCDIYINLGDQISACSHNLKPQRLHYLSGKENELHSLVSTNLIYSFHP